jgi:hypothetical protein
MKQYTKHYEYATNVVNNTTQPTHTPVLGGSSAKARSPVSRVGLLDTHVLQSPLLEQHDRFLEITFKEWEQWLNDYHFRQFQRKQSPPHTPTDFVDH